jgi:hypothetical protein
MTNRTWHRNRAVIWLCILLFPLLVLILLRMKRDSIGPKLLGSLAVNVFDIAHQFLFRGLRVEMDGGMRRPRFSFKNTEKHRTETERRRAEERSIDASQLQAPLPIAAPSVSPAPDAG